MPESWNLDGKNMAPNHSKGAKPTSFICDIVYFNAKRSKVGLTWASNLWGLHEFNFITSNREYFLFLNYQKDISTL